MSKFGLPPTDCAENPSPACFGNTGGYILIEPHLGNQNYGQYSTYYPPLNLGGGNIGGGGSGSGIMSTILNTINNVAKGTSCNCPPSDSDMPTPECCLQNEMAMATITPTTTSSVGDIFQRITTWAKANPIPSLLIGGGVVYAISKAGK